MWPVSPVIPLHICNNEDDKRLVCSHSDRGKRGPVTFLFVIQCGNPFQIRTPSCDPPRVVLFFSCHSCFEGRNFRTLLERLFISRSRMHVQIWSICSVRRDHLSSMILLVRLTWVIMEVFPPLPSFFFFGIRKGALTPDEGLPWSLPLRANQFQFSCSQ